MKNLKRYPFHKNDLLQAWDSADELILEQLHDYDLENKRLLIINDQFGALRLALKDLDVDSYTDSFVSFKGLMENSEQKINSLSSLQDFSGVYDLVLIRLPKNMSFFEDILCSLTPFLHQHSKIICTVMVKHLAPRTFDLLQKYIGDTTTSLAKKKARLIFSSFERTIVTSPYPQHIKIENFDLPFTNHSNLFSREKLDIGSRFFLEHIPQGDFKNILDLGCANGIIGIKAKMMNPQAKLIFSDESAMAVASAQINYKKYFSDEAQFLWTNCFENQAKNSLDLVLCNPPFHQGTTIGSFIAYQMFSDTYHSLRPGGLIRIIGNTHLGYELKLKQIFGNAKMIASNKKFIVCEAKK